MSVQQLVCGAGACVKFFRLRLVLQLVAGAAAGFLCSSLFLVVQLVFGALFCDWCCIWCQCYFSNFLQFCLMLQLVSGAAFGV